MRNVQGSGRGLICDWPNNCWSHIVSGVLTKVQAGRPGARVSIPDMSKVLHSRTPDRIWIP